MPGKGWCLEHTPNREETEGAIQKKKYRKERKKEGRERGKEMGGEGKRDEGRKGKEEG